MSLSLDATASARIAAGVRGAAWLIDLDFTTGTLRYTTAPVDVQVDVRTYTGGKAVDVSALSESENSDAEQLTLGFVVDVSVLALVLGSVETYRGRAARMSLQLFDEAFQPAGLPVPRWAGVMNKVQVTRQKSDQGPGTGRIELQCSRAGMARARNAQGLRLSHAQQLQRYPGDQGLQYVQTLIEKPSLWLSKRFQAV